MIQVTYDDHDKSVFWLVCDVCDKPIADAELGMVKWCWNEGEGGRAKIVHKNTCDMGDTHDQQQELRRLPNLLFESWGERTRTGAL